MTPSVIEVADRGAVRILTIAGPKRRNALAVSTVDQLHLELAHADADTSVGAVVLTGAGGHFSAGGDAESVLAAIDDESDDAVVRLMSAYHRVATDIWHSRLPVVAAVAGIAYGGAFNLALACDLVVCASDARFCQIYVRRGVVPDLGGGFLLPRLVGMQRAKELMLLAPEIDADSAVRLGLVSEVLPTAAEAFDRAIALATRLAGSSRYAVSQTKRLVNASAAVTFESALDLEAATWAAVLRSPHARRAFAPFRKRNRDS